MDVAWQPRTQRIACRTRLPRFMTLLLGCSHLKDDAQVAQDVDDDDDDDEEDDDVDGGDGDGDGAEGDEVIRHGSHSMAGCDGAGW